MQRKTAPVTKAKSPSTIPAPKRATTPLETAVPAARIETAPTPITAPKPEPAAPKAKTPTATAKSAPTTEEIAFRAYELYLARGKADGHHAEDWLQAERELSGNALRNN